MTIFISNIINYPQHSGIIAEWYMSFWGNYYPTRTIKDWQSIIGNNIDKPPLTLIAIDTAQNPPIPIGTASLILDGMEKNDRNTAWLSALYVIPEYREKGVATRLIQEIIKIASKQYGALYLFTRTDGRIYHNLGWGTISEIEYQGNNVLVMIKQLKS